VGGRNQLASGLGGPNAADSKHSNTKRSDTHPENLKHIPVS
jgi:hypothetical protein